MPSLEAGLGAFVELSLLSDCDLVALDTVGAVYGAMVINCFLNIVFSVGSFVALVSFLGNGGMNASCRSLLHPNALQKIF